MGAKREQMTFGFCPKLYWRRSRGNIDLAAVDPVAVMEVLKRDFQSQAQTSMTTPSLV